MRKNKKKRLEKSKQDKKNVEKYTHRKQLTIDNLNYGLQRLDLLIISIGGAGIYACLETLKFLIEQKKVVIVDVKIPASLFIISIVANLISQYTGVLSNKYDYQMCDEYINCDGKEPIGLSKSEIDSLNKKSQQFDDITTFLNISSLIILIVGLILLMGLYSRIIF